MPSSDINLGVKIEEVGGWEELVARGPQCSARKHNTPHPSLVVVDEAAVVAEQLVVGLEWFNAKVSFQSQWSYNRQTSLTN